MTVTGQSTATRMAGVRTEPSPDQQPFDPSQIIDGEHLLGPSGWVVIAYRGQTYRLSRTRAGKLILTK